MENSTVALPVLTDNSSKEENEQYIKELLTNELPRTDIAKLGKDLQWNFILKRQNFKTSTQQPRKKKAFLTRKERKNLGLLKLPKTGWNYADLESMRALWLNYIQQSLNTLKAPKCDSPAFLNFHVLLGKVEFIGAVISIIKSKVPSLVGITGTIVLETKHSFQIVTPKSELKTLLKKPSVFQFQVNKMEFTIFGKHMLLRPQDRSIKKNKALLVPDL